MVTFTSAIYPLAPHTGGGDQRSIGFGLEFLAIVDANDGLGRADVTDAFLAGV